MEHIIQFGINIDDEFIKQRIEERGYEDVVDQVERNLTQNLMHYFKYDTDATRKFYEDHKEEIIDRATKEVVGAIKNSKRYKEAVSKIAKELLEG